jgi:3-oxoacyl-[acyl-carrier-protein] synthase-1
MQDVMFAGGGEELSWGMALLFDGMGAMSSKYNATPEKASRPTTPTATASSSPAAAAPWCWRAWSMRRRAAPPSWPKWWALAPRPTARTWWPRPATAPWPACAGHRGPGRPIDYINTHGTSTPVGDMQELRAMRKVFGDRMPPFSSTKSLTGHSLGATGVQEAIFCLIMLNKGFIAGSANVETPDPAAGRHAAGHPRAMATLRQVLSNSFGFGGTNACLVLRHWG